MKFRCDLAGEMTTQKHYGGMKNIFFPKWVARSVGQRQIIYT